MPGCRSLRWFLRDPSGSKGEVVHAPVKFLDGMAQYAQKFPGEVVLLANPARQRPNSSLGMVEVSRKDLAFECVVTEDLARGLRNIAPDAALMPLSDEHAPLIGVSKRTVLTAEHTGRSRLEMARVDQRGLIDKSRVEVGFRRLGQRLNSYVVRADGVQCNGIVAWRAFASLSRHPIRVYDNRVRAHWVEIAQDIRAQRPQQQPLRLGFSGRLIAIKGPQFAVALPAALRSRGIPATLDVMGDGPMRAELEASVNEDVQFLGSLDFESEWCDHVARNIDIMVLPHVQSDPSGTYLESAGMGVPIVGFDNSVMVDLAQTAGFGWAARMKSHRALVGLLARISEAPSEVARASAMASSFMTTHNFESDFETRVQHILDVIADSPRQPA